jgi:glycerophosphoryl diester phosphodiesterase
VTLISAHACTVEGGSPNTLAGLQTLLAHGVEMVEFDVRSARDGVLVAHHGERLPDGRLVRDAAYAEVAASYPPEARPALIGELLQTAAGSARVQLDLKEAGVEAAVELALDAVPAGDVVVTTLLDSVAQGVKSSHPAVTVGLSLNRHPASFVRGLARARLTRADLLAIHYVHLRTPLPAAAAAAGLALYVWTVDDDRRLLRVLRDPRVACVITNRPLRARELRARATSTG